MLDVRGISRAFGGVTALRGVTFQVHPGQIKAVIGPNGAGKTTLFNVISGLLKADTGEVCCRGESILGLKPYQIASGACRGPSRTSACSPI